MNMHLEKYETLINLLTTTLLIGAILFVIANGFIYGPNVLITHIGIDGYSAYGYTTLVWATLGLIIQRKLGWKTLPFLIMMFGISELAFNLSYLEHCSYGATALTYQKQLAIQYKYLAIVSISAIISSVLIKPKIRISLWTVIFPVFVMVWLAVGSPLIQPNCEIFYKEYATWNNLGWELSWQLTLFMSVMKTMIVKQVEPTKRQKNR